MAIEKTLLLDDVLTALQNQQITTLTLQAIQKKEKDPKAGFKANPQQSWNEHTVTVRCVALLPDGRVVSGSSDNTLKVWDVTTGQCVQTLRHGGHVMCVALLSDGQVVSGSQGKKFTLTVWDVTIGQYVQTLSGHTSTVFCVAVLSDGRVVSGSSDHTLKVWDVKTGQCVQTLSGHRNFVRCVALLPDGRVVSGGEDKTLKVWDVKTGQCVQTLSEHTGGVLCVAALPDGRVVSGGEDKTLKVWKEKKSWFSDSYSYDCVQTLSGHTDFVQCVALLPDGQVVSGASGYRPMLKVWNMKTGKCVQTLSGHTDTVFCVTLLPDGRVLSGSKDKTLKVWEREEKLLALTPPDQATVLAALQTNTSLTTLDLSGVALVSIPQGFALLTALVERHPRLSQLNLSHTGLTDTMLNTLLPIAQRQKYLQQIIVDGNPLSPTALAALKAYHERLTKPVATSPIVLNSQKDALASESVLPLPLPKKILPLPQDTLIPHAKPLFLEDTLNALQNQQLTMLTLHAVKKQEQDPHADFKTTVQQSLSGHTDAVRCVAVLPDGRVVSGSYDKTLKVWDVQTGQCVQTLNGHTHLVYGVAVLPDGRVVSGSYDKTLKVWDVKTGTCVQTLSGHTGCILCVAALPDGRVVSGTYEELKVWDVKTGQCVQTISRYDADAVMCVALLPDGRVVSGSLNQTLKVWDVKTGKCVQILSGHTGWVRCVTLLPDGQVISGSEDNTLKVWDVKTGTCVQTLSGHTYGVSCVTMLPDGRVVSGSDDKTLKVWDVMTGKCVQTLSGHTDYVYCVALLPDGQIVSGVYKELKVWKPETKQLTLNLTPQDQVTLLAAIKSNTSLTHLNLSGVALADIPHGVDWLTSIVEKHPLLKSLDLSQTGLTDAMFNTVFRILCGRKRIEVLTVEGNPLLSQSAKDQVKAYQASLNAPLFPSPSQPTPFIPPKEPELPQKPVPETMPQPKPVTPPQILVKTPALPFALQTIAWQNITVGERIGEGGYGVVYAGSWSGIPVAIKQLHITTLSKPLSDEFNHETQIMAQCQFPYIVRLYGVCVEPGHTAMVMEYLSKGSLFQVLHDEKEALPWNPVRWNIAIDVSKGLVYLHGQNILHRDLKSLNVLLDKEYQAKISDFGLSKVKLQSSSTSTQTQKGMGTTRWRAPELFKPKAVPNFASDIYSYGMILWEIASRTLPFNSAPDDTMAGLWIMQGEKEEIPPDCPKAYGDMIQQCWEVANQRPTAQVVMTLLTAAKPQAPAPLPKPEPKPYAEKSWHFDPETKAKRPAPDKIYELVDATDKDKHKVIQFYQHHPVEGYDIGSVHVIYNADMNYKFGLYLKELQQRDNNPAFKAKWPNGQEHLQDPKESDVRIAWRSEIHQQCLALAKPYQDSDYPAVNLLPMWHGTKKAIVDSIFKTGYANLATTDAGFFGKGIYGAHEAEYSYRVYAKQGGALILNWTACFSPYPVMDGDMKKLEGKGNYSNYDAHFVPVVPRNPDNPNEDVYYPTKVKEPHTYNELVVFQSNACLPRYLVELQPTLVKPIASVSSSGYSGTFFPAAQPEQGKTPSTTQQPYSHYNVANH